MTHENDDTSEVDLVPLAVWSTPSRNEDRASEDHDQQVSELLDCSLDHLVSLCRRGQVTRNDAPVQALALTTGAFGHLYRLTRLAHVSTAAAVSGPGTTFEDFSPLLRELTRLRTLEGSSSIIYESVMATSGGGTVEFEEERRRLTALEMNKLSTPASHGALVQLRTGPEGHRLNDRMVSAWRSFHASLKPRTRAWLLTASEADQTKPEKQAEMLLPHETLADLYGTTQKAVTDALSKARRKLKRRVGPLAAAADEELITNQETDDGRE